MMGGAFLFLAVMAGVLPKLLVSSTRGLTNLFKRGVGYLFTEVNFNFRSLNETVLAGKQA